MAETVSCLYQWKELPTTLRLPSNSLQLQPADAPARCLLYELLSSYQVPAPSYGTRSPITPSYPHASCHLWTDTEYRP